MKQFHSKLGTVYENLNLIRRPVRENEKPDFTSVDNPFKLNDILHKVYTMVELTVKAGRNEDVPDKEKLADYEKFFKDILHTIEAQYVGAPRDTFTPEDSAPLVPRKEPEIGGRGMFRLEIDRGTGELIGEYQIDGGGWYKFDGIEFKNLSTGEPTTSPTRIQRQLARAIRFNPDFQEDGAPKYDVTSPATRASADAGGPMTEVGKWMVSILWGQEENKPLEAGESWNFKLVPETTINRR